MILLLISIVVNYYLGLNLAARRKNTRKECRRRKIILIGTIVGNIGVLAVFKGASGLLGLPLGISFYTFQILSYLIDVYRGEIRREWSFLKLATYVCMFPQLVSGPIVTYPEVSKQLAERSFTPAGIQDGLKVFTMGLAAKTLLADPVGLLWHEVQTAGFESISTPLAWLGAVAYSMQLYFDFYGYSLMAVGLGRMLGFELPMNFQEPYMAKSVRDFYRRWHMTLGRWFRKYVYIPLGGNRRGEGRTILNLLIVWILTSLWHGGTANFLIWGFFLWFLIVMERLLEQEMGARKGKVLSRIYLWIVIPISWMCFAITDLQQLGVYLSRMFGLTEGVRVFRMDWQDALKGYGGLLAACAVAATPVVRKVYQKIKDRPVGMILLGILFWICVRQIIAKGGSTFMYRWF